MVVYVFVKKKVKKLKKATMDSDELPAQYGGFMGASNVFKAVRTTDDPFQVSCVSSEHPSRAPKPSSCCLHCLLTFIIHPSMCLLIRRSSARALCSQLSVKIQCLFVFNAKLRISCVTGHKILEFWFPYTV